MLLIISENLEATYDIWFIGDVFLCKTYKGFQESINRAKLNRKNWQPYMLDFYNPKLYVSSTTDYKASATGRILNKLINALNENDRLPKFICIIPDWDLIADLKKFDYGAAKNLSNIINWLMRQCDILVRRKRLLISEKKPGAVMEKYPTLIFTTMLKRIKRYPRQSKLAAICSLRPKLNQAINETAARQESKVLNIRSCTTFCNFDRDGMLTQQGKASFWREFDNLMERFEDPEETKIKLEPTIYYNFQANHGWNRNFNNY